MNSQITAVYTLEGDQVWSQEDPKNFPASLSHGGLYKGKFRDKMLNMRFDAVSCDFVFPEEFNHGYVSASKAKPAPEKDEPLPRLLRPPLHVSRDRADVEGVTAKPLTA